MHFSHTPVRSRGALSFFLAGDFNRLQFAE